MDFNNTKFRKPERLKSKKVIGELFKTGKSVAAYPLRLVWVVRPPEDIDRPTAPLQFTVSVSKKKFKHAVDRNLLRRRTREAFRLQKTKFYTESVDNQYVSWLVIYTASEILSSADIARGMKKLFRKYKEAQNAPPPVSEP